MRKMKKIILMAILLFGILMVGCSHNEEEQSKVKKEPVVENKKEKESKKEKELENLIICENHDINTGFVPVYSPYDGWGSFNYLGNFYETLVNYKDGEIMPSLATSWEINDNELIFNLRKGVKFTDGSDFNAEVVKKNFDMNGIYMDTEFIDSFTVLNKLKEVKVIDEYTVKLILSEPYYAALRELSMVRPMGIMSPNVYTDDGISKDIHQKTYGTGKYMIENAIEGEDYTFIRNDNYWGEKPKVKQFTVKNVPDSDSRMMALKSGEVDFVFGTNNISYDAFVEFQEDKRFLTKISEQSIKTKIIILNTQIAPFDNVNVRRAIEYAINKQEICDSLLYGIEKKADYLFNPDLPYCDIDLEAYYYDIEKSKSLLDKAGWLEVDGSAVREKDGEKLKTSLLYEAGLSSTENLTLSIIGQLESIGFEVETVGADVMTCMNNSMGGDFSMFLTDTYGVPYEPHVEIASMITIGYHKPAQEGLAEKEELFAIIKSVSNMTNKDNIQEAYNYILRVLHNKAVYIPISYKKEICIFNKDKVYDYIFNGQNVNIDISGIVPAK